MSVPHVDIIPGRGIKPIEFGMSPDQVALALTKLGCLDLDESARPSFNRAFSGSLQIGYDAESQQCCSVNIYWHPGCGCECSFQGQHVMNLSAEELFRALAQLDGGDHEYRQQEGHSFPSIGITLFDLSSEYDYRDNGSRLVYGEIIVERSRQSVP